MKVLACFRTWGGIVVAAIELVVSSIASAQSSGLDTQLFLPTASVGTGFTVDHPSVPTHGTFVFGLGTNFGYAPFVRSNDDARVLSWVQQTELLAAVGLFEWIEVGAAIPMVVANGARDAFAPSLSRDVFVRAGDVRLSIKVPAIRGAFSLAGKLLMTLPSGDSERFVGANYATVTPTVVWSYNVGNFTVGGDAGYRLRRRATLGGLEIDDEIHLAVAGNYAFTPAWAAIAESQLRVGVGGRTVRSNEVPWEIDVGARWTPLPGFTVDVGGGAGILSGYGAPSGRGFVVLRYATAQRKCEAGPEDMDGFEDGDFCADVDNDRDGLLDASDACVNDAEDKDRFLDDDGCPDLDNDGDGVKDALDRCPLESEDVDGYQDDDGCPELDNDEDGLVDGVDHCPMEPEDTDRFEDEDGCPEPGPSAATITVTDTRILISERIYFDFDLDTVRSVSLPLLNQVAEVILALPSNRRIRVEGYSDSAGNDEYNLDLSYRRARAVVEYLAARGVPRDRLEYAGYGEKNPVAPNDTPEGQALNRRVEFTILEPADVSRRGTGRR